MLKLIRRNKVSTTKQLNSIRADCCWKQVATIYSPLRANRSERRKDRPRENSHQNNARLLTERRGKLRQVIASLYLFPPLSEHVERCPSGAADGARCHALNRMPNIFKMNISENKCFGRQFTPDTATEIKSPLFRVTPSINWHQYIRALAPLRSSTLRRGQKARCRSQEASRKKVETLFRRWNEKFFSCSVASASSPAVAATCAIASRFSAFDFRQFVPAVAARRGLSSSREEGRSEDMIFLIIARFELVSKMSSFLLLFRR